MTEPPISSFKTNTDEIAGSLHQSYTSSRDDCSKTVIIAKDTRGRDLMVKMLKPQESTRSLEQLLTEGKSDNSPILSSNASVHVTLPDTRIQTIQKGLNAMIAFLNMISPIIRESDGDDFNPFEMLDFHTTLHIEE